MGIYISSMPDDRKMVSISNFQSQLPRRDVRMKSSSSLMLRPFAVYCARDNVGLEAS